MRHAWLRLCLALVISVAPSRLLTALQSNPPEQATGTAQTTATQESATGTIDGVVVSAATGEPLKKAIVTLQRTDPPTQTAETPLASVPRNAEAPLSAATDATGHFVFAGLGPGHYHLWASRNGYLQANYTRRNNRAPQSLVLGPGEHVDDVEFRLTPTGVIAGKVVDEDGEPVNGAMLQVLRYSYGNGGLQLLASGGTNANDLGDYRLSGLAPGKYYIMAAYAGEAPSDQAYAPAYYPGVEDPAQATPLELGAGAVLEGVDFTLTPTRAVRIRGRIVSAGTRATNGNFGVTAIRRDTSNGWSPNQTYSVSPQGDFEIRGLVPGPYVLFAQWWGAARGGLINPNQRFSGRLAVDVSNRDLDGVTVVVGPGITLKGRVQTEGTAKPQLSGLQVYLEPREQPAVSTGNAMVAADGSFVFTDVPDGVYRVRLLGGLGDSYLKSISLGGADALDSDVPVSREEPPGSIDIVLSPNGGQIEGAVLDHEQPYASATVALVPDPSHRSEDHLYQVVNSDPNGRFALQAVPPGDYKLFAWEQVENGEYMDPDFLRNYETRGKSVHVDGGGALNVQLELIPAGDTSK